MTSIRKAVYRDSGFAGLVTECKVFICKDGLEMLRIDGLKEAEADYIVETLGNTKVTVTVLGADLSIGKTFEGALLGYQNLPL